MLTTHFYPFLTIFRRAHAPIIISSSSVSFWGENYVPPSGALSLRFSIRRAHRVDERRSSRLKPFFAFFLRLLINICIFFLLLHVVWDGNVWCRRTRRRVGVNMWLRREKRKRELAREESQCMWNKIKMRGIMIMYRRRSEKSTYVEIKTKMEEDGKFCCWRMFAGKFHGK